MTWIFITYLLVTLCVFLLFTYDDVKYKELGVFDGIAYLLFAMAWPFLLSMYLVWGLEEWYYDKFKKKRDGQNQ